MTCAEIIVLEQRDRIRVLTIVGETYESEMKDFIMTEDKADRKVI